MWAAVPTTIACATKIGTFDSASTRAGETYLPVAVLKTSFFRSVMRKNPSASISPMSPVWNHPSTSPRRSPRDRGNIPASRCVRARGSRRPRQSRTSTPGIGVPTAPYRWPQAADGNDRRGFREAVALHDRYADAEERHCGIDVQRRASAGEEIAPGRDRALARTFAARAASQARIAAPATASCVRLRTSLRAPCIARPTRSAHGTSLRLQAACFMRFALTPASTRSKMRGTPVITAGARRANRRAARWDRDRCCSALREQIDVDHRVLVDVRIRQHREHVPPFDAF